MKALILILSPLIVLYGLLAGLWFMVFLSTLDKDDPHW